MRLVVTKVEFQFLFVIFFLLSPGQTHLLLSSFSMLHPFDRV